MHVAVKQFTRLTKIFHCKCDKVDSDHWNVAAKKKALYVIRFDNHRTLGPLKIMFYSVRSGQVAAT